MSDLPMSLRRAQSELDYQEAKLRNELVPLHYEPLIKQFKHWSIIDNRFPYDVAYQTCHLLIPHRVVPEYKHLRWAERWELRKIIDKYAQTQYDQVVENMAPKRSVKSIYHLHLLKFYASRREMKL